MNIIQQTDTTTAVVCDTPDPKAGGACHVYEVRSNAGDVLLRVEFQHGPVLEAGVNGVQHADLLAIVRHRLDSFQSGAFASAVNEVTCGHVAAAMASEETRTRRRKAAGVEGRNIKAPGVES